MPGPDLTLTSSARKDTMRGIDPPPAKLKLTFNKNNDDSKINIIMKFFLGLNEYDNLADIPFFVHSIRLFTILYHVMYKAIMLLNANNRQ